METVKDVRKRILKASLRLFMTRGFARVTTQELSESLGISKKTLYQHFPSKDEIVLSALQANFEGLGRRIDTLFENPSLSFEYKITALLSNVGVQMSRISTVFMEDVYKHLPEAWQMIDDFRKEKVLQRLGILLREGQEEGSIRRDIDIESVLFLVFNTVTQVLRPELLLAQGQSFPSLFNSFISLVYGGVFVPASFERLKANMEKMQLEVLHGNETDFIE